jgi:protein-disulfide isomerase
VRAIARGLLRRAPDAQIHAWLRARFEQDPQKLNTANSPCRGAAKGSVELVVFSDFQCPACAFGRFIAETLERHAKKPLRVCFKNFPLTSIHPDALGAAVAAMAAHRQGKFWAMHDRLFDQQRALGRDQLLAHARALGLDPQRFAADLDAEAVRDLVARDRAEASALGLRGTPTFFIDGRRMTDPMALPDFLDWIAEAAELRARATSGSAKSRSAKQ